MLLMTLDRLPASSDAIKKLSISPSFLSSIGKYLERMDENVRKCGMIVAETVAAKVGQKLDFGGNTWYNDWIRSVKQLLAAGPDDIETRPDATKTTSEKSTLPSPRPTAPPVDKKPIRIAPITYDSDDSLTAYSSPSTSRSASPTPSEEQDPTLSSRSKKRKPQKPVYVAMLAPMLSGSKPGDGVNETPQDQAERIALALESAAELIRRKKHFGTELRK